MTPPHTHCPLGGICRRETESISEFSKASVSSEEVILRGAYYNIHYIKNKKIVPDVQTSFIKNKDLKNGELSIWRKAYLEDQSIEAIKIHLDEINPVHEIRDVFAPQVQNIRNIADKNGKRLFCVLDDTKTGPEENHVAHASISFCESLDPHAMEPAEYQFAKRELIEAFKRTPLE